MSEARIGAIIALWNRVPSLQVIESEHLHAALPDASAAEIAEGQRIEKETLHDDARIKLLTELLDMQETLLACRLVAEVAAGETRGCMLVDLFVELLIGKGLIGFAREFLREQFSAAMSPVQSAVAIHAQTGDPSDLGLARSIASIMEGPADDCSRSGIARHRRFAADMAFIWRTSQDASDLALARARCEELSGEDRALAYASVARNTLHARDYLAAFAAAAQEPDPNNREDLAWLLMERFAGASLLNLTPRAAHMLVMEVAAGLPEAWAGELLRKEQELKRRQRN